MEKSEVINNVYAYNVKMEEIHISEAKSGRNGYYCLGCQKEMQAVKSQLPNRISFFRHDHNASKGLPKCTYSDETYRHKLAKQLLIALKRVKVPALYKYPPKDIDGMPMLLSDSKFIEAEYVRPELYFYENELGEVMWGRSSSSEETKYLLLKPDIVFFDKEDKPILLIELVVTHKITPKKQLDLKRLGIDTIQVTIPKDSQENIERTFTVTERTKWIYNYGQDITEYIPISNQHSEGILPIDEDQRKLLEESAKCRKAQINNLIRTITRCLESEQYTAIAGNIKSEISRVEGNTETYRESYDNKRENDNLYFEDFRRKIRKGIDSRYRERRENLEKEQRQFKIEEGEFLRHYEQWHRENESNIDNLRTRIGRNISEKYRNRRESTEKRRSDLEERYNRKATEIERIRESSEGTFRNLHQQISTVERDIIGTRERINDIVAEKNRVDDKITNLGQLENTARDGLFRELESRGNPQDKFKELRIDLEERIKAEGISIEERFSNLHQQIREAIKTRTFEGNEYTRGFKNLLADLGNIDNFITAQENYRRYEKAWRCFTSAVYLHWHD
jgi:hypothetical protein